MRKSASRILGNVVTLGLAVTSLQSSGFAQEVIFWDDFGDTTLRSEWVIDPGRGSYSLTSHPGFLTYNLDQWYMNNSDKPDDGWWPPSLGIEYPFEGTEWKVEVHVFFELRYWKYDGYGSTGGQFGRANIRFADGSRIWVQRGCDAWYDKGNPGRHRAHYSIPGDPSPPSAALPFAPGDVVVDGSWIRHDYWYQFERSGNTITIRYSFDGLTYDEGLTTTLTGDAGAGNTQTLVFDGTCFSPHGSTAQWDYVRITDTGNQPPIINCNDPVVLWSPDHSLIDVSEAFTAIDPDGDPLFLSFQVISDESETPETGDGTGKHAPDFKDEVVDDDRESGRGLLLRSERRGKEDGRFYIVVITAADGRGGVTTEVCIAAVVPHDQDEASLVDDMAQAQAALTIVDNAVAADASLPPDGMYLHGSADEMGPKQ